MGQWINNINNLNTHVVTFIYEILYMRSVWEGGDGPIVFCKIVDPLGPSASLRNCQGRSRVVRIIIAQAAEKTENEAATKVFSATTTAAVQLARNAYEYRLPVGTAPLRFSGPKLK